MRGERLEKGRYRAYRIWRKRFGYSARSAIPGNERYVTPEWRSKVLGSLRKTACSCSCWMCGNPRKFWGEKTLPEYIADISESEQRAELVEQIRREQAKNSGKEKDQRKY